MEERCSANRSFDRNHPARIGDVSLTLHSVTCHLEAPGRNAWNDRFAVDCPSRGRIAECDGRRIQISSRWDRARRDDCLLELRARLAKLKFPRLQYLIEPPPLLLIKNGQLLPRNMRREL